MEIKYTPLEVEVNKLKKLKATILEQLHKDTDYLYLISEVIKVIDSVTSISDHQALMRKLNKTEE